VSRLAQITQRAWQAYVERIAGCAAGAPWWTAVVVTASSERQAQCYRGEIERRCREQKVPDGVLYLVVPDPGDRRVGSGTATLHALAALCAAAGLDLETQSLEDWWGRHRVLMIHSGGEARRLPQYSLTGKLFTALPVTTPWGEVSTVFDETLALSTGWMERFPNGALVASGDVVLTFEASALQWDRGRVTGVAMRQPVEVGSRHGVYVTDPEGRVYTFLQKPSAAQVQGAGGLLPGDQVALDTGLLRFDPALAARLTLLGADTAELPVTDLYEHLTLALTGQWRPAPEAPRLHRQLQETLQGASFCCCLVDGDFTHIGTTGSFRRLITEETGFTELYAAQQRLGAAAPPGVRSAGVIIDSVLAEGSELASGALALECHLEHPVRAARGAILHGLTGLPGPAEAPEDTVFHQVPILLPDGRRGVVIRVYGAEDDPKLPAASATWLGRPLPEALHALGLEAEAVWPGVPPEDRSLWNAALFPLATVEEAWHCAAWLVRLTADYPLESWLNAERLSLAASARWVDGEALAAARTRRAHTQWQTTAIELAAGGADIRPLLAHAPGVRPLAGAGQALAAQAEHLAPSASTQAASRHYQAAMFLGQAGLAEEAARQREAAFRCVASAVGQGVCESELAAAGPWRHQEVTVQAAPRIDLGGGWSDTPPFCLDWGGTVLNIAVALAGEYPIRARLRRLGEPRLQCVSEDTQETAEFDSFEQLLGSLEPGSALSLHRAAFRMLQIGGPGESLRAVLERRGGGLEIRASVDLPLGSGLGTSSILAAALLRALAEMLGVSLSANALSDHVMLLEQQMTTGGGWQDQAGGIFPGAKLVSSGPGLRQRLRVEPVGWSAEREAEFCERLVLYYTGIRRIAKDLLRQVVGRYLARETEAVQVLHSIKTLASEMAWAMREGEWEQLGQLLDRHWQLNQVLDPNTTNAPINALLEECRPYLAGAKLAGAGGGGFLLLLARDPEAARKLRTRLSGRAPGALQDFQIAKDGLRVEVG